MSIKRVLKTTKDIQTFLGTSSWSTQSLLGRHDEQSVNITNEMVDSLLELSGFSKNMDKEKRISIGKSLAEQLQFVNSLKDVDFKNATGLKRLVDDNNERYLDYSGLVNQIEALEQEVSKGEVDESWNGVSLAKESEDGFYVVNEGLIKKDK